MPTADRLLELLALFTSRPQWSAVELAARMEVTERTVRRDVDRLRSIGYPIDATPGLHGGYRLGPGGKLPPLLLDDDEAVAMAVGLAAIAASGSSVVADASVSALAKLDRVLPPQLRERVAAIRGATVGLQRSGVPAVDTDVLITAAVACQRPERLRFDYLDGAGRSSMRHVEPFRLVVTDRRWYLVAYDKDRADWRTFRLDRMSTLRPTGTSFVRTEEPDAAELVARGVAVFSYEMQARIRFHQPRDRVVRWLEPTVGIIDGEDEEGTIVRIGGDPPWVARYLAGLEVPCTVLDPPEVVTELRRLARALLQAHRTIPERPQHE